MTRSSSNVMAGISGDELSVLFPTGAVKVLVGCAPCQPFSTYSQRYDSSRDGMSLLNEFGRIAEELLPDALHDGECASAVQTRRVSRVRQTTSKGRLQGLGGCSRVR